jgi:hypothetical protein
MSTGNIAWGRATERYLIFYDLRRQPAWRRPCRHHADDDHGLSPQRCRSQGLARRRRRTYRRSSRIASARTEYASREANQLVLHVDDLIKPGPEQIAFLTCLRLLRSHRLLPIRPMNQTRRFDGISICKSQASVPQPHQSLQSPSHRHPKIRHQVNHLSVLHGRRITCTATPPQ